MVEEREERRSKRESATSFFVVRDVLETTRRRRFASFSAQQLTVIFVPHHAPRGACGVRVRRKVTPMTWNVSFRIRNEARRRALRFPDIRRIHVRSLISFMSLCRFAKTQEPLSVGVAAMRHHAAQRARARGVGPPRARGRGRSRAVARGARLGVSACPVVFIVTSGGSPPLALRGVDARGARGVVFGRLDAAMVEPRVRLGASRCSPPAAPPPTRGRLRQMRVAELRAACAARGLDDRGRKSNLVSRLEDAEEAVAFLEPANGSTAAPNTTTRTRTVRSRRRTRRRRWTNAPRLRLRRRLRRPSLASERACCPRTSTA